ncbi:MAG TPA: hypothetical protein VFI29_20995 [Hanamia sp.]|nr:hypothetical protein [Hanamia sp.]
MQIKFKSILTVSIVLSLAFPVSAQQKCATLVIHQVGPGGASTIFSFYNTCPESPDGQTIAYLCCKKEPSGDKGYAPAELWLCDRDLKRRRKVTNIVGTAAHNGVEAQWIDNDRIAFFDKSIIRIINVNTGKDLLKKKINANGLGHYPYHEKILYDIYPGGDTHKPVGTYELDCNTQKTRLVISTADCACAALPSFLQKNNIAPVDGWRTLHAQYSPDGRKIAFRLDVGPSGKARIMGICNVDGSDLQLMVKQLHFVWYDNQSIISHYRLSNSKASLKEKNHTLIRSDLHGNMLQALTPPGNHLAVSPDRRWFASETNYWSNPVILTLYPNGHPEKAIEITRFNPNGVTWKRRFHVNPEFSRDSKRLYFSMPLNEKYNGTFYVDIK